MEQQYIGRYRVLGKLGKGGMGTVVRAVDEARGREVAIKLPNDSDPDDISRLRQECDVLMQLQHHHVVEIYGSGSTAEAPFFIVMEYVEGVTVEQLLRQQGGPLEPRQALTIALGVAEALAYAHRPPLRVIHRDIKPSNVLLRASDNAVKVTDFGIAAVLAERSGRTVIGTADYMPPEQARREGVDERSDLYSLGVMLYQMLTGQLPPLFASAPAQPPSRWLGSMPPEMSARIDWLILGLLVADRSQRQPQTAAALVETLRALLEGRPARQQSGPPIDPAIANAPTRRASAPPVTNYQPSGTLPASGSQPAAPYTPLPGYQLVPVVPTTSKSPVSKKANRARWLGVLSLALAVLTLPLVALFFVIFFGGEFLNGQLPFLAVLAIPNLSLFLFAVITGHRALGEIRRSGGQMRGRGRAIAGLITGYISFPLAAYWLGLAIFMFVQDGGVCVRCY
jgi:serine/threonine-protein kinase